MFFVGVKNDESYPKDQVPFIHAASDSRVELENWAFKKKVPISSHRKRKNFCPNLGWARGCTTSSRLAKDGRKDPTVAIWRDNHDLA